ncbi:MAG TPA: 2Fe-2S iron-sulfur cluster binding domain-containing protein, partial [Candidatus Limisoma intestinavium]|nr:2Fe-2S iron-sulfur cluster binding domain-containing protein [Candidatus Limisoma intestinavium]
MLLSANLTIVTGTLLFFAVSVLLVAILLLAKKYLVPTGNVKIKINDDKVVEVPTGGTLLSTLSDQKVFLPSACGGSGSCGQCRVRITE